MKKTAQNLVEFVLVFPLLIILLLGILEFGLFFRNVSVVQDIAEEAAVAASRKIVTDTMACQSSTYVSSCGNLSTFNSAILAATNVVLKRKGSLGINTLSFTYNDLGSTFGNEPYTIYQMDSLENRIINGVVTPILSLIVDYRNPIQNGISLQLVYQYRTLLIGASFPVMGGTPIVIIPRDMAIRSTNVKQYIMY